MKPESNVIEELHPLTPFQKVLAITGILFWAGYLVYRALFTLSTAHPAYALFFLAAEAIGFLSLLRFAYTTWRLRKRVSPPLKSRPKVDVYIATYNEEPEILLQTIYHCKRMDYPHETFVLDDGRRPEIEKLALEMGVRYLTRPDNRDAKAGNLNHALPLTSGEIIAILDADGIPRRDFLTKLLGYFEDPSVALVQVPQTFYNVDSFQHLTKHSKRHIWHEQSLFFDVIEPGLDYREAAMCSGSGSLVRRSAINKIGGFTLGTVTEDLHTTFSLHQSGFKTVYHPEALAYCLAPATVTPYVVQRGRWALGSVQMLRIELARTLGPGPLTLAQRILYLTPIYYLTAVQKLAYMAAPVLYLCLDYSPFEVSDWFVIPLVLNMILSVSAYRVLSRGRSEILMTEVFFLYTLWPYIKALVIGLLPVKWRFRVTPKGAEAGVSFLLVLPAVLSAILSAGAFSSALWQLARHGFAVSVCIAAGFAWFNTVVSYFAIVTSRKRPFSGEAYSFFDYRPLKIAQLDGHQATEETLGIATVISEKNLSFVHSHDFKEGSRLRFELDLPDADVELEAKVVRSEAQITSGQNAFFLIEVKYIHPSERAREELVRYFFEDATPRLFSLAADPWEKVVGKRKSGAHEKRSEPRLASLIPIYVGNSLGLLMDLSSKGARVKFPTALDLNAQVEVSIPWLDGRLAAKVVRCTRESGHANPPCDIGLEFVSQIALSDRQKQSILELRSGTEDLAPAA